MKYSTMNSLITFSNLIQATLEKKTILFPLVSGNVMHSFPNPDKFPERFKAWVNLVGYNLETLTDYDIYKKKRICDIHFTDEHRNRCKRLNALAMPTLYLPGELNIKLLYTKHKAYARYYIVFFYLPVSTDLY